MFDYIKVEGIRRLKFVELNLFPLTVLIGPNGSGKSNFLDLLSLVAEGATGGLGEGIAKRGGFENIAFKGEPGDAFIEFRYKPEGAFHEERAPVLFRVKLKKVGSGARVWFEQVSKAPDAHHPTSLTLMHRDKDGCMFRSIKTGLGEELVL